MSVIDVPDDAHLARTTEEVNANNRLGYSLAGLEKPRQGAAPLSVPPRHGEPTTCNFDDAGALTETILLGVVANRSGKTLEWDARNLKVTNETKVVPRRSPPSAG